ncbi:MAG TPA: DNA topoisomerase 4 subunit A [Myxococcota bacterium]|nr:DNA topoisomerase 4 subunit A [Myxococcota bacterium]
MQAVQPVALPDAARERYLSYALSVITSRALPDVRDGLKPVQRRILYTMFHELSLGVGSRYRKSAAVVGEVMGKYHPHGDQSIYDALVRMAQPFSLLAPLVDPQGNFGSLDGDPPAAMRYTECRLSAIAEELLREIRKDTVDYRASYDGQRDEPIVLPAQFPQLLVNGVEGIAVGLATRIPPHNLGEVIDGCVALIDGEAHSTADLVRYIPGPDLPTGGRILNDRAELVRIYEEGQGSVRMRGEWTTETEGRRTRVVITSIPYGQNKARLIERIGADVEEKKLPQVVDLRDESTDDVRVVLELKPGASPEAVMAYLYRRTPLETTFPVQMNALVPTERVDVARPERLDLKRMLDLWLEFRNATVRRRFEHDLRNLEKRIHILEAFAVVFDALDEILALIRASEGKKDAARKMMDRFGFDEVQTEAILDLQLYKLAKLEILVILDELEQRRAEAADIRAILGSEARLWDCVKRELLELKALYAQPRRTVLGAPGQELTFDEQAYIEKEETFVIVTRGGWLKRQSSFTEVSRIRVKEHDEVGWLMRADTTNNLTVLTSDGTAFTLRVGDVPATTGHGSPLSRLVTVADGAQVVGVILHDPTSFTGPPGGADDDPPGPYLVGLTRLGRVQRLLLEPYTEISTRAGRRFARLDDGDAVLVAEAAMGGELVSLATRGGNALVFPLREAPLLRGAGKGTNAVSLKDDDAVYAAALAPDRDGGVRVTGPTGKTWLISEAEIGRGSRAANGKVLFRRGEMAAWHREPVLRAQVAAAAEGGEE